MSDTGGNGFATAPYPPPFVYWGASNTSHSIWAAPPAAPRCQKVWLWEISPQRCAAGLVP